MLKESLPIKKQNAGLVLCLPPILKCLIKRESVAITYNVSFDIANL